jgi:hypothetical protein
MAEAVRSLAARQLLVAGSDQGRGQVQVRGDLGIHELGLYKLEEAIRFLVSWLPRGPVADHDPSVDANRLLAAAERSALVTATRYTTRGSAETVGTSTDLILARHDGRLHAFAPVPGDRGRLGPRPLDGEGVPDTILRLLS